MSELIEIAILAYRNARYRDAIELFLQVCDSNPNDWLSRLYLGMAYEKTGRVADAHRLLKRIASDCPDHTVRDKAENALPLVEAEMRRRFEKQPATGQNKKPTSRGVQDNDDIVWVG
jgi:cytochrome c-type biogenesis protein CcmH/NrfG